MQIVMFNRTNTCRKALTLRWLALLLVLTVVLGISGTGTAETAMVTKNSSGVLNRALAVDPTGNSEGYKAVLYDNTNGLPTSEANAIAETSDGFIWIGSYAGLIRYDGNTFERLEIAQSLSSIKCLYVDSRERLWIGTNDSGIGVLERGELRKWNKLDGLKSAHTRAITEDQNGNIYVATTSGIVKIDVDLHLSMMDDPLIAEANMRDLRFANDGLLYGLDNFGSVFTIKDDKVINYIPMEECPIKGGIGSIFPDPANPGMMYCEGADYKYYHVRMGDTFSEVETVDISPLVYVMQTTYIDGSLWICASNGIGVLKDGQFRLLENLPMNSNIGGIMTDYLGNLWFTSTRQGVMKVVPNQFFNLFERYQLEPRVVNTTCMSGDTLLVGTDTGLLAIGPEGPVSSIPLKKAVTVSGKDMEADDLITMLDGCRIRSILRDSKGRIWISVWRKQGLIRYDQGEAVVFTQEDGLLSTSLRAVAETEKGQTLVAVAGGVNVIEGDQIVGGYGEADGISNTESLTVSEGFNGDIVLGTNGGGIYVISDSGVRNIDVEHGMPSDIVMRLKKDRKNNVIWIISSSAIAYLTPDYKVTTISDFPYTNNFDLYENSRGDMWVLSSNGVYVTPTKELLANGEINSVHYSLANGLPCITTANSYSELTDDGELYIAGNVGVCKVNINQPFEDVNNLHAGVPFVIVDRTQIIYPDENGTFTIPKTTTKLTVPSFVFNYSLSDPKVSYRMEGVDDSFTTVNRSELVPIDYTNLRGGTYHYVMQIQDTMGVQNKEVSVEIIKVKAFYEEVWFYIVAGAVLIFLLVETVRFTVRRKTRALEKKHQETMTFVSEITDAFAKVIDMKDEYTKGHSNRVANYTEMLATELGYDKETVEKYHRIALLHDIGKIGVPKEVLNKPGKLTDDEFKKIQEHTTIGYDVLKNISIMPELSVGAQAHHERPDGRGYPNHLKGNEIPRVAQIIAVADCFDAMYSDRPYRKRMNFDKAVSIIKEVSGTQLTPDVVDAFLRLVDKGLLRAEDDVGGGTTENIDNIRK